MAAAAVAVVLSGLAACSSSSPSASSTRPPAGGSAAPTATATSAPSGSDVCANVPTSTVTASFGGSASVAQAGPFLGNPACIYAVRGSNLGVDGVVQIAHMVIWKAPNYEVAKATGLTGGDVVVTGVGDDAYYDPNSTGIVFHKGDTVYFVLAQFKAPVGVVLDAAKMKADVIALAKAVAATL
ncbi:MAG: hypothetical protein QOH66_1757 [Actinomycetota bacterium]|nr:hypothetical protein [Actinomycetota bacterium]